MHQFEPGSSNDPCGSARRLSRVVACGLWVLLWSATVRAEGPPEEMWAPVRQLVAFMSRLPPGEHPPVFAPSGLCIVENYAPYLFCGPAAARRWEIGFRAHSAEDALTELAATFGEAQDFGRTGDRAYFSLPTTWTGRSHGRAFEEHGAWAFVLARTPEGWRIVGYGWGVTRYTESGS